MAVTDLTLTPTLILTLTSTLTLTLTPSLPPICTPPPSKTTTTSTTTQELVRCDIDRRSQEDGGDGGAGAALLRTRVLLLATLKRTRDRWVLHATSEPRKEEARKVALRHYLRRLYRNYALTCDP